MKLIYLQIITFLLLLVLIIILRNNNEHLTQKKLAKRPVKRPVKRLTPDAKNHKKHKFIM